MSSANDGSEPRSASERSTGSTRGARVDAPRAGEGVAAGSSRTPPPRNRRGAPTGRPAATLAPDVVEPEALKPAPSSAKPGRPKAPKPPPGSSNAFDWDGGDTMAAAGAGATAAITPEPLVEDVEARSAAAPRDVRRPKMVKRPERRFRQTIVKVDLWSVTKMALCFYVSAVAVTVVALAALWVVADSAGIIGNVEKFIGDLFSSKDFHFVSAQVLRGAVLVAVVVVALMVVFTIIAASFYNIFAELFGGVEVVIREEENPPKR